MTLKLIQWLRWLRESVDSYAAQQVKHTQLKSVYLLILSLVFSHVLAWYYTVASSTRMKFFLFSNIRQCVGVIYVMCSICTYMCLPVNTDTRIHTPLLSMMFTLPETSRFICETSLSWSSSSELFVLTFCSIGIHRHSWKMVLNRMIKAAGFYSSTTGSWCMSPVMF